MRRNIAYFYIGLYTLTYKTKLYIYVYSSTIKHCIQHQSKFNSINDETENIDVVFINCINNFYILFFK